MLSTRRVYSEHLVRLYASLKMMHIDPGMTIDEMEALTLATLESNKLTEDADVSSTPRQHKPTPCTC